MSSHCIVPLVILTGLLAAQLCKEGLGAEITIEGQTGFYDLFYSEEYAATQEASGEQGNRTNCSEKQGYC